MAGEVGGRGGKGREGSGVWKGLWTSATGHEGVGTRQSTRGTSCLQEDTSLRGL